MASGSPEIRIGDEKPTGMRRCWGANENFIAVLKLFYKKVAYMMQNILRKLLILFLYNVLEKKSGWEK